MERIALFAGKVIYFFLFLEIVDVITFKEK
jgi:hypothetical protein